MDWTAGDFDYDALGNGYSNIRRPDQRIQQRIHSALGEARCIINVGAGAGSYEPRDRYVVAVEPSRTMRKQRPSYFPPAIDVTADNLPFDDDAFDAAMSVLSVHHWSSKEQGLRELRRVTRGPIVIVTFDPEELTRLWLAEYVPELFEAERQRYSFLEILDTLGGRTTVKPVPIPIDCTDGFTEAFYARPEAFLDSRIRAAQSAWKFVDQPAIDRGIQKLQSDLASGAWHRHHGHFLDEPVFHGALRLLINEP